MYGIVEEGSGQLPDGGFAKYRVRWDGRIDDWYARKQCLEYVISDGPICREDLVPAVVVPASSAHFEGGELLLYAMARKGCTIWHRRTPRPFCFFASTRRWLCAPATPSTR